MHRLRSCVAGVALIGAMAIPSRASAAPVFAGTWYSFCFGALPGFAVAGGICGTAFPGVVFAPAPTWSYASAAGGTLTVVDGFFSGDLFTVLGSGFGGPTSPSIPSASFCGFDPAACLANPGMSKGVFAFGAGTSTFDIHVDGVRAPAGGGYFRIEEAAGAVVPEPASMALVATGLFGLGLVTRRRRSA